MRLKLLLSMAVVVAFSLIAATPSEAQFFGVKCHANQNLQVDPIAQPGIFPSAHLHTFCMATNVTKDSTVASLENGGTSAFGGLFDNGTQHAMTPAMVAADTAGQWTPTMYVNGVYTPYKWTTDYWSNTGIADTKHFVNVPEGLQLIGGNSHATSPADAKMDQLYFDCGAGHQTSRSPVICTSSHDELIHIDLPVCWDGTGLKPSDSISPGAPIPFGEGPHNYPCPAAFPKQLPRIQLIIHTGLKDLVHGVTWSSGPWYTIHADYWQTWKDQNVLLKDENFIRTGQLP